MLFSFVVRSSSSDYWEDGLQVLGSLRNTYSSSRSASPEPTLSKPVNLKEDKDVMERESRGISSQQYVIV